MTQDLEKTLWATADKVRNNMDDAEYKYVVLGLIFFKYISDRFDELYTKLKADCINKEVKTYPIPPSGELGLAAEE